MPKKLLIFPFGGNARESLLSIMAINVLNKEWEILGFVDDSPEVQGNSCCGVEVIGGRILFQEVSDAYVLAVPGSPETFLKRKAIIEGLGVDQARFATILHPSVATALDSKIGHNTLIMPNCIISCNTKVGNHCVILPNTVVSHDSIVEDYCCIGSNVSISGSVHVRENCYIGSGCRFREHISIGNHSLIGLGSNVISDIEERAIAAGNPARVIRRNTTL